MDIWMFKENLFSGQVMLKRLANDRSACRPLGLECVSVYLVVPI